MRCPSLAELPAPPRGRTGWPWTLETPRLPEAMPAGNPWPRISIVVASLDQGDYVEEMLRSVLLQGYPDVELIVVDGGSEEHTLAAIRPYLRWFAHWVSEPDGGQSQALNKGLAHATGALVNFMNTDDYFLPGCFGQAAQAHTRDPGAILAGDVARTWQGEERNEVHYPAELDLHAYAQWWSTRHEGFPGMFFPCCHLDAVGPFNENLHFLMDYEFTLRYLGAARIRALRCPAAVIRHHPLSKSVRSGDSFVWECIEISEPYQKMFPDIDATARRQASGILFGFGVRRLLLGQGDWWRFVRKGWRIHPFWAVYWLVPGWFLRKFANLAAR